MKRITSRWVLFVSALAAAVPSWGAPPSLSFEESAVVVSGVTSGGSVFGDGAGASQAAVLAHEIAEQFSKQVQGASFPVAHAAGYAAQDSVSGLSRGAASRVNRLSTSRSEVSDLFIGSQSLVEVTVVIDNGNVVQVRRFP